MSFTILTYPTKFCPYKCSASPGDHISSLHSIDSNQFIGQVQIRVCLNGHLLSTGTCGHNNNLFFVSLNEIKVIIHLEILNIFYFFHK